MLVLLSELVQSAMAQGIVSCHYIAWFLQRALQLSNVLKEISRTQKFANFDVFYMDFPLKQSKWLFPLLSQVVLKPHARMLTHPNLLALYQGQIFSVSFPPREMQPPSLNSVLPKASPSVGTSFSPVFPSAPKILLYSDLKDLPHSPLCDLKWYYVSTFPKSLSSAADKVQTEFTAPHITRKAEALLTNQW